MSVHQESLDLAKPAQEESVEEAPELEYSAVRNDSLAMFGAALGGAVLGMLLTLLMLAIVNGGTLNFSGGMRQIAAFEANLERINENVGAVSANVDVVAERTDALQSNLDSVATDLRSQLGSQSEEIAGINDTLGTLDQTRQQFDIFVGALNTALSDMETVGVEDVVAEDAVAEDAVAEDAPAEATAPAQVETIVPSAPELDSAARAAPTVEMSPDVAPGAIQAMLFTDSNTDGIMGDDETNLIGLEISILNPSGEVVASATTTEAGALFPELEDGEYLVQVDDALGYELLSEASAVVVVDNAAEGGVLIYVPVGTTAE